jgi:pyridoxine 5-phosphate synthase
MTSEAFAETAGVRLCVNLDHVATVRQTRRTDEPDPVRAAVLAELGGADGITVHLRDDRRHIQDRDVLLLLQTVRTFVNLEVATADQVVALAEEWRPYEVTLVPENRQEVTTEGGLDVAGSEDRLRRMIPRLSEAGIRVSLFIDPDLEAIDRSAELRADAIELHTGEYANSSSTKGASVELERLAGAARHARDTGLAVHAGHGLTYENVLPVAALPECEELNIGHSIISRSVFVGVERAVREMKEMILRARSTAGVPS